MLLGGSGGFLADGWMLLGGISGGCYMLLTGSNSNPLAAFKLISVQAPNQQLSIRSQSDQSVVQPGFVFVRVPRPLYGCPRLILANTPKTQPITTRPRSIRPMFAPI